MANRYLVPLKYSVYSDLHLKFEFKGKIKITHLCVLFKFSRAGERTLDLFIYFHSYCLTYTWKDLHEPEPEKEPEQEQEHEHE
jgi:hypothetical protein